MLREGIERIKLYGEWKPVNMEIEIMDSFSAHGDRNEMLDFIKNQKKNLKQLFLVHGVLDRQKEFKAFLHKKGFPNIAIPSLGNVFKLPLEKKKLKK